jgi:hypothetical protein
VESLIHKKPRSSKEQRGSDEKPLGIFSIPYVGGVFENFRRIRGCYNIRIVFKTKQTSGSYLRKTKSIKDKVRSH